MDEMDGIVFVVSADDATEQSSYLDCLHDLLVRLHALYAIHRSAHWQTSGASFYGDHLLFQRLYEPLDDEIDALAERMVATVGPEAVDPQHITAGVDAYVQDWIACEPCPYERARQAEGALVECVQVCMDEVEACSATTLGWDDFLGRVASKHEEHIYL